MIVNKQMGYISQLLVDFALIDIIKRRIVYLYVKPQIIVQQTGFFRSSHDQKASRMNRVFFLETQLFPFAGIR